MIYPHSILICPVCSETLIEQSKLYSCANNHTFDKAKQGYVNLLLSNQKKTLQPGDSKEMVKCRLAFLKQGYYLPIVEAINKTIEKSLIAISNPTLQIADLGCGVGYYLSCLKTHLSTISPQSHYWGIDISKEAIHYASQHDKTITWLVGSAKKLPFRSESVDILLSVFSPLYNEEVQRVLSPNGLAFVVTPAHDHLLELRNELFDEVKQIDAEKQLLKSQGFFELVESVPIRASAQIESSADIDNLLKMTPFYWRSSAVKKEQLLTLDKLAVTIDVTLWVFKAKKTLVD